MNFLRRLALQGGKKTWQLASRCCWNRARPWHASELVSFLVGQRTYQDPVPISRGIWRPHSCTVQDSSSVVLRRAHWSTFTGISKAPDCVKMWVYTRRHGITRRGLESWSTSIILSILFDNYCASNSMSLNTFWAKAAIWSVNETPHCPISVVSKVQIQVPLHVCPQNVSYGGGGGWIWGYT